MTTILLKKSSAAGAVPLIGDLSAGEVAINLADRKMYVNNGTAIVRMDGAYVDSAAPTTGAAEGDLWFDTGANMLKTYNGTAWVSAGYTSLSQFGVTASAAEINYTDGVTSNIQVQLDDKSDVSHTHAGIYEPADATILKDADIGVNVQGYSAVLAGTTASFTTADETKLDGIEAGADVTDTTNVAAAGAAMTSGATFSGNANFGDDVKAVFGAADDLEIFHESSSGRSIIRENGPNDLWIIGGTDVSILAPTTLEDLAKFSQDGSVTLYHNGSYKMSTTAGGVDFTGNLTGVGDLTMYGNLSVDGTVDGRNVAADGTKLDGVEAGADVTDAANVTAAGALMDSECTNVGALKAINQNLTMTSDVEFNSLHLEGNLTVNGTTTTVNSNEVSIGDSVILLNSDEAGAPTQNAGFEVERGTSANVSFIWNETNDAWDMGGHNLQNVVLDGGTY